MTIMGRFSSFLDIVILLGALQGIIFSVLLFSSAKERWGNRLLAWLLVLMSVASLKLFCEARGYFEAYVMRLTDAFVPLIIIMPIGPLIYFYVRSCLHQDFRLSKADRRHFYPVLIDVIPQVIAVVYVLGLAFHAFLNKPAFWGWLIDTYNVYSDIPRWACISFYLWLSAKEMANYTGDRTRWLRELIRAFMVFQGLWLLYLIPYVIPRYTDLVLNRLDWYPVYVPMAILIYWLGIKGYIVSKTASAPAAAALKPSRSQSVLPDEVVGRTVTALRAAMEHDKLYLDPALTVAQLSGHTGIAQKQISAVLNQYLHKSFSDFVNEYRIRAIKDRLLGEEARQLTIAGMAYDGGFNSLPTFQRAFKAFVGQTPKEFMSSRLKDGPKADQ